jgi:hypothetical protein
VTAVGRGCVKTKTDVAANQFCKVQTSKSYRFETRLGFFARFAQFAKVPRVFKQPRPVGVPHLTVEVALNAWQVLALIRAPFSLMLCRRRTKFFLPQWLRADNRRRIFGQMRGLQHWRDHSIMNS